MSCGNRFQCGITRFQKHSFTPDKPSNLELHNENQKRLNDLLKAREDIDKLFTSSHSNTVSTQNDTIIPTTSHMQSNTFEISKDSISNTNFTTWKTPSAGSYQAKLK